MIGGQTLFVNAAAEENFMPVRNETGTVENQEIIKAVGEPVTVENAAPQIDLTARLARLKKTMRRRSSSIF